MREMVKRAKDAPLIIKANLTTNLTLIGRFSDIYTQHLHHISTLDMRIRGFTLGALLKCDKPAPMLETFSFRDVGGGTANWSAIRSLFSRDLPSLENVAIRCELWQWEPRIFLPTLKTLKLECARYNPNDRTHGRSRLPGTVPKHPTWAQFHDALSRLSKLRQLDLENAFPVDPPNCLDKPVEPVHLPALKDLLIFGNAKECAEFLDRVSFPLRCDILVRVTFDPGETPAIVAPAVRRQLESWDRKPTRLVGTSKDAENDPLRTLTVSPVHSYAVLFRAWPFVLTDPVNLARLPVVQQEKLTLSLISETVRAAELLRQFAGAMLGSTLHTLCRFSYTSPAINHHQSSIIVVILSSCHPIH